MVSRLSSHHCMCAYPYLLIWLRSCTFCFPCHIICLVFFWLHSAVCYLFVCLFVCLSVCLFVCLSVCLFVCCCLFVCWYVHISCYLNVGLFVCLYIITSAPWSVTHSWVSPWTAPSAQGVALNGMVSSGGSPLDLYTPKMQETWGHVSSVVLHSADLPLCCRQGIGTCLQRCVQFSACRGRWGVRPAPAPWCPYGKRHPHEWAKYSGTDTCCVLAS